MAGKGGRKSDAIGINKQLVRYVFVSAPFVGWEFGSVWGDRGYGGSVQWIGSD